MIVRAGELSMTRQCQLLGLCRSALYYRARPVSPRDLGLMRRLDELHLAYPFLGARRLAALLRQEGQTVGRRHVARLMRQMGITAVYRRPRTSLPDTTHTVYPYLLSGLAIERANHVWAADITALPMAKGFLYLVAVLDVTSRKVLGFRLSNTLTADFCVAVLQEARARSGRPEIFNTDQGAQFTSQAFTGALEDAGVRLSMDSRGRWMDNVFIERLWRSVKYEEVYLHAYDTPREAHAALTRYFDFYNSRRPHQALSDRTPDAVYYGLLAAQMKQVA